MSFIMPADLIFSRSKSLLGGAIRWFERGRGEDPSFTNHTAGIGLSDNVIEAVLTVTSTPYSEWSKNGTYQVWRTSDLLDYQRKIIAGFAAKQIGRKYGVLKLVPHAMDGLLSKITGGSPYVFRRLLCIERYPICSWVWTHAYAQVGLKFGSDPDKLSPDDMLDFCEAHPGKWSKIYG